MEQGYTFDPATVKFEAFGGDWSNCAASFPIHMGRALGLSTPIERRFDLINAAESPMLLDATPVEQNLSMPKKIRLFIFKIKDRNRSLGERYVAQYWEGIHGIMDSPHVIAVDFPSRTVQEINLWGYPVGLTAMTTEKIYGRIIMNVGCGGHTPYYSTLVMAEHNLSLKDFRSALLNGKVFEIEGDESIPSPIWQYAGRGIKIVNHKMMRNYQL